MPYLITDDVRKLVASVPGNPSSADSTTHQFNFSQLNSHSHEAQLGTHLSDKRTNLKPQLNDNVNIIDIDISEKYKNIIHSVEVIEKYYPPQFKVMKFYKVNVYSPRQIYDKLRGTGLRLELDNSWEDDINYVYCYLYDNAFVYNCPHEFEEGKPKPLRQTNKIIPTTQGKKYLFDYFSKLMTYPIPNFTYKFLDIEVKQKENQGMSDETCPILCCSIITYSEKLKLFVKRVFVCLPFSSLTPILGNELISEYKTPKGELVSYKIIFFNSEYELFKKVFDELDDDNFFILVTFNGDNFDLRYLNKRGKYLGFKDDEIPIELDYNGYNFVAYLKKGIHIDIQRLFGTGVLTYSYPGISHMPSLDEVAQKIVGDSKIHEDVGFDVVTKELCDRCFHDSYLLYEIFTHDDSAFPKLLILLSRLYNVSLEDISRTSLMRLNTMFFQYVHRVLGYLIPNRKYFEHKNKVLKVKEGKEGKSYAGGIVYFSKPGIYFDVDVYDFKSQYPGVIDKHNLSYETLACPHEECKDNKVPEHDFHVCKKFKGVVSMYFGAVRDLRISFKDKIKSSTGKVKNFLKAITGALKICILSNYGMFGRKGHKLTLLALSSAICAYARRNLMITASLAEKRNYNPIYGDTDSVFTRHLTDEERKSFLEELSKYVKVEVDYEKHFKYVVISRKKNYLGVFNDGSVDVKGLLGKKRHMCEYLRGVFNGVLELLKKVNKPEDFEVMKGELKRFVRESVKYLKQRKVSLNDLVFKNFLSKDVKIGKGQVYDVARLCIANNIPIINNTVEYVLTKGRYSAKPVQLVRMSEVDVKAYIDRLRGMLEQIFDPLDIDLNELIKEEGQLIPISTFTSDEEVEDNIDEMLREGIEKWF